jgi:L-asparaginase II
MSVKLAEVTRSNVVESIHRGDIAVVNFKGEVLAQTGDLEKLIFLRSASKPIQGIAAINAGVVEKYNLDLKEIAILVSSHNGEKEHIEVLLEILKKIGASEEQLECGIHDPTSMEEARKLLRTGSEIRKLHCNCSGKHIGLIAASKAKGFGIEGYYKIEHQIHKEISNLISEFSNLDGKEVITGIDGCGVPVFAVPIKNAALMYANLCSEKFQNDKYKKSQNYILSAMTKYPEMVAGKGRFDTELMRRFGDRLIGKIGAEGVYCVGIIGKGIGIALKIEDGNSRAISPVILELLLQLKIINKGELEQLQRFWRPSIMNHRGEKIGEIIANFDIDKGQE